MTVFQEYVKQGVLERTGGKLEPGILVFVTMEIMIRRIEDRFRPLLCSFTSVHN